MAHITDDGRYITNGNGFFDTHPKLGKMLAYFAIGTVAAIVGITGVIMTVNASPV